MLDNDHMFCDRIMACIIKHSEMYYIKIIGYLKHHIQIAFEFHICLQNSKLNLNVTKSHIQPLIHSKEVCYVPTMCQIFCFSVPMRAVP